MFLDDVCLGSTTEDILQDLEVIESAEEIGLHLNNEKSEIICHDPVVRGTILFSLPGARVVDPSDACLLGSPIGNLSLHRLFSFTSKWFFCYLSASI